VVVAAGTRRFLFPRRKTYAFGDDGGVLVEGAGGDALFSPNFSKNHLLIRVEKAILQSLAKYRRAAFLLLSVKAPQCEITS